MTAFRWTSRCHGCGREAALETRYTHGARALCDDCATIPFAVTTDGLCTSPRAPRRKTDPAALERIAARLQTNGLRPIIDGEHGVIRAECPTCWTGEQDDLRLYRPLVVIPGDKTRIRCDACGADHVR